MIRELGGRARLFGDHLNTDYIITSTRKRDTLDVGVLRQYLFETVNPAFAASVEPGDLIVAGRNFGCGSAMEIAATVILAAGINAVVATSFARTFYRNAINNGLIPIECDTSSIAEFDALTIHIGHATLDVTVDRLGRTFPARPLPAFMLDILDAGGVVPYLRTHGRFPH